MNSRLFALAAASVLALTPALSVATSPDPAAEQNARLDRAAALDGALDRPARLARLCLDAQLACGFELRSDVWKRPESRRRMPSATVGQALKSFIGRDYVLLWRDGVLLMTPAGPAAPLPLDAQVSADVREESPADPSDSLRAVARGTGLRLKAAGKPRRIDPSVRSAANPSAAPARRVLALWDRAGDARPSSWVAVYSRDGRSGALYWFWGEGRSR